MRWMTRSTPHTVRGQHNNTINADSQKRRTVPLLLAGYGERYLIGS